MLSKKAWLQSQLERWSFRLSKLMSKHPLKKVVSKLIKDKDITSYQLLLIKQDRVLVNYLLPGIVSLDFFFFSFFTFRKKWVGRAMGNETLHWDGLRENNI